MPVWLIVLLVIAVIRVLLYVLKPTIKGKSGETMVGMVLNRLPSEQYRIIHNLLLKTERGTSQIDYAVVSIYGIFVIEVKNYVGWITGSEYGNQWTQTIYHSKHRFLNPIHQNYGHMKAIEKVLNDTSVPIYSIITFPGDCKLMVKANHSDVVLWGNLNKTIQKYSMNRVMDTGRMERIVALLKSSNIDSKENRKEHLKEINTEKDAGHQCSYDRTAYGRNDRHQIYRKRRSRLLENR